MILISLPPYHTFKVLNNDRGRTAFSIISIIADNCEKMWLMQPQLQLLFGFGNYQNRKSTTFIAIVGPNLNSCTHLSSCTGMPICSFREKKITISKITTPPSVCI